MEGREGGEGGEGGSILFLFLTLKRRGRVTRGDLWEDLLHSI